jgi:GPH family glycoside/pentoside/hexuronide:cation symporter
MNGKLSILEKVGYGAGDAASNIFYQGISIVLFFYYTDVQKIDPFLVGVIFSVTRIWDAVNDPAMGLIADRTKSRWGSYRPYLLYVSIPFGVLGYLMFAIPDVSEGMKILYAGVTYGLFGMLYTAINVPYSALMGVMTPDAEERTKLAKYRFVGAFSAMLVIGTAVRPMVGALGNGNEILGYKLTFALLGTLAVVLFIFTFLTTKERIVAKENEDTNVVNDLKILVKNKPWLVMFVAGFLTLSNVVVRNASMFHYFKYYVKDTGDSYFLWMDLTSWMMTSGAIAFIVGIFFTNKLRKKFGKRNALIGLTILNAISLSVFFVVPPSAFTTMLVVNAIANIFAGPTPALVWAMYTDVADYGELKFKRRTTALVFSGAMFSQKMGWVMGGTMAGFMLSWCGFEPDVEQSSSAIMGIRVMFSLIPGVFMLANGLVLFLYTITEEDVEKMEAELAELRQDTV